MGKKVLSIIFLITAVVATFTACVGNGGQADNTYKITYTADVGGRIEGLSEQVLLVGRYAEKVTAVAYEGYIFKQWSDGLKEASRSLDRVWVSDKTYTAYFYTGFLYKYDNFHAYVCVSGYVGTERNLVVPEYYENKPISEVGGFARQNITNITLPNTVNLIDANAFMGCSSLESVIMSSQIVEIGNYAFYGCHSLTSIHLPATLETLGINSFGGSGIKTIYAYGRYNTESDIYRRIVGYANTAGAELIWTDAPFPQ